LDWGRELGRIWSMYLKGRGNKIRVVDKIFGMFVI
jgi:hypothetical protein